MRVFGCIVEDHNLWLVFLAGLLCLIGATVSSTLFRRTFVEQGVARVHWCFLSAVTAGAATWATHFIAMLGYEVGAPVTLDGLLTVMSALIAISGIGFGLVLAALPEWKFAPVIGGATIGLAIAAMHYTGMFAYRVDGIVRWDPAYVFASLAAATVFGGLTLARLTNGPSRYRIIHSGALLTLAIISLHFIGMAAFVVSPMPGVSSGADSAAFSSMAAAIGMVALLIVGAGISTYLLERKTEFDNRSKIAHIAMHDALTDLANRRQFTAALEAECGKLRAGGRPFALMVVDLDRFKPINDTLGHPVGDKVLKRVSERLRTAAQAGDIVARFGGDEFAIINFGVCGSEAASVIAERVVEILRRPIVVDGNVVEISGSVGLALAPQDGDQPDQLIQHADVALYAAKHGGKSMYCAFEPSLMDGIKRKRALEASLRRAAMRDDFGLVYQPVIDAVHGTISGAEALLRWHCADHGDISPDEFVPLAEELGLVSRIGSWVLHKACEDAAKWPAHIGVSVNVSPVQLLDPRLVQMVSQAIDKASLAPERLELEITETALLGNDETALATLERIREMGVRISLDDFGTGYSSLSYLHRFPISRIKIDKSFVQKLPDDPGSASIVRAITKLGENLNLLITAEGIENESQLAFLRGQGCRYVQGYLTGRPVANDAFLGIIDPPAAADRVAAVQKHASA